MSESASPHSVPVARRRRPGLGAKLLLAGTSVVVFLVLSEIVLRFCGFGQVEIYEPDRRLYWRLRPNQNCFTKVDRKPVHINSRGTRGPEFAVPKPAGVVRILSLGDSKTFGWGAGDQESYSAGLERLLQEKIGATPKVEVINAGVNAWSYPQLKVYLREIGVGFQPDYVLIADANLWTQFSEDSDPAFVDQMISRVRLKNWLRRSAVYHFVIEVQLAHVYQKYRTKFIPVDPKQDQLFKEAQKSDPDAVFRTAIEETCQLARGAKSQPVVMFIPRQDDLKAGRESNVQKTKRELCTRLGIPWIDTSPELLPVADAVYLDADPVHLTVEGNALVARRLAEEFAKLLKPPVR